MLSFSQQLSITTSKHSNDSVSSYRDGQHFLRANFRGREFRGVRPPDPPTSPDSPGGTGDVTSSGVTGNGPMSRGVR